MHLRLIFSFVSLYPHSFNCLNDLVCLCQLGRMQCLVLKRGEQITTVAPLLQGCGEHPTEMDSMMAVIFPKVTLSLGNHANWRAIYAGLQFNPCPLHQGRASVGPLTIPEQMRRALWKGCSPWAVFSLLKSLFVLSSGVKVSWRALFSTQCTEQGWVMLSHS